jgi:hypothetical protein
MRLPVLFYRNKGGFLYAKIATLGSLNVLLEGFSKEQAKS